MLPTHKIEEGLLPDIFMSFLNSRVWQFDLKESYLCQERMNYKWQILNQARTCDAELGLKVIIVTGDGMLSSYVLYQCKIISY